MDAGRLFQVLSDFIAEAAAISLPASLSALVTAVQASINSPNANTDQQFRVALSNLYEMLEKCPSNSWPPSKKALLEQAGLATVTGRGLRQRIAAVLSSDMVMKSTALAELGTISNEVQQKITQATQSVQTLGALNVKAELPPPEQAEVTFLLPSTIDTSSLEKVQQELKFIDQLLRTLSEINGEGTGSTRVQEISKGSLIVVATAAYATARALLNLVDRAVEGWQRVIDLKRQQSELEASKVPQPVLDGLKEYIDGHLTREAAIIAAEFVKAGKVTDEGRRNELETKLKISTKLLAARIDVGAKIEAAVSFAPASQSEPLNAQQEALKQEIAQRGAMMRETPQLEKPVLSLSLDNDNPE